MYALAVSVLLYLFPPKVIAKLLVVLMRRLATLSSWTKVDDDFVDILEERVREDDGQGG